MQTLRRPPPNDPGEWDLVAEAYEQVNEPFMGMFVDEAIRLLEPREEHAALDVAAGPGTAAVRLAPRVRRVLATDYADGMVERLRARVARDGLQNVDVARMDGQDLRLDDASFDLAVSAFGLIFFPDRGKGFRELRRVLRPGGRAAVLAWGAGEAAPVLTRMMMLVREHVPELPPADGPPPMASLSDPARFRSEMEAAGFEDVAITSVRRTVDTGIGVDAFWEATTRSHVLLAWIASELPPERWAQASDRIRAGLRELVGSATVEIGAEVLIGTGRR